MNNKRKVLFWLEDQPLTVERDKQYAIDTGFEVYVFSKPFALVEELEKCVHEVQALNDFMLAPKQDAETSALRGRIGARERGDTSSAAVIGLVLDIMLLGVGDLSALAIRDSYTDDGFEAGWRFLDLYIRRPASQLLSIPVLLLSFRPLDKAHEGLLHDIKKRGGAEITFVEKYAGDSSKMVARWLDTICN